jgi:hypothetical protein
VPNAVKPLGDSALRTCAELYWRMKRATSGPGLLVIARGLPCGARQRSDCRATPMRDSSKGTPPAVWLASRIPALLGLLPSGPATAVRQPCTANDLAAIPGGEWANDCRAAVGSYIHQHRSCRSECRPCWRPYTLPATCIRPSAHIRDTSMPVPNRPRKSRLPTWNCPDDSRGAGLRVARRHFRLRSMRLEFGQFSGNWSALSDSLSMRR